MSKTRLDKEEWEYLKRVLPERLFRDIRHDAMLYKRHIRQYNRIIKKEPKYIIKTKEYNRRRNKELGVRVRQYKHNRIYQAKIKARRAVDPEFNEEYLRKQNINYRIRKAKKLQEEKKDDNSINRNQ